MACCGSRRALAGAAGRARPHPLKAAAGRRFFFRHTGPDTVTVPGPVSGLRYRFAPGAVVEVDPRDAARLAAARHLEPA